MGKLVQQSRDAGMRPVTVTHFSFLIPNIQFQYEKWNSNTPKYERWNPSRRCLINRGFRKTLTKVLCLQNYRWPNFRPERDQNGQSFITLKMAARSFMQCSCPREYCNLEGIREKRQQNVNSCDGDHPYRIGTKLNSQLNFLLHSFYEHHYLIRYEKF